jgi:hypothetical protein
MEIDGKYRKMVAGIRLPLAAKVFIPPETLLVRPGKLPLADR